MRSLAVGADGISYIYLERERYLTPFGRGKVDSGCCSRSLESRCKGGDEVGSGMGKSGGVPDGGVPDGSVSALVSESVICGGGEWEVDGASALSRIMAALYPLVSRDNSGGDDKQGVWQNLYQPNGVGGLSRNDILQYPDNSWILSGSSSYSSSKSSQESNLGINQIKALKQTLVKVGTQEADIYQEMAGPKKAYTYA
ncbi:hypothetical protein Tco_0584933 [Tanacetum coccineum]